MFFLMFSGWAGDSSTTAEVADSVTISADDSSMTEALTDSSVNTEAASESENSAENSVLDVGVTSLDTLLINAQNALQNQEWMRATESLERIRLADSSFREDEVQRLLVDAYFGTGKAMIADSNGEAYRFQDAQTLFRQAATIDPENQEVRRVIEEVNTYLVGARAIRLESLQQAADILQPLYGISPDYLRGQVGARLYEAYVAIGDRAMRKSNTQVAVDYYGRAQNIAEVTDKSGLTARLQSIEQVRTAQAGPTPTATVVAPPTAPPPPPPTAVPPTAPPPPPPTVVPPTAPPPPPVVSQAEVFVPPTPTFTPPPPPPPPPPPSPSTSGTLFAASCPDSRAVITSPLDGETVRGVVAVKGRAVHEEFGYYKIEFSRAESDRFSFLTSEDTQNPGDSGQLTSWDTSTVPDGDYRLRITVVRKDGNYPPPCDVKVVIKNSEQQ